MKNERRADQKRHIKYPRSGQQYFCPAWKLAVGHIIERPRAAVCKLECQLSKAHQRPGADINCDNGRPEQRAVRKEKRVEIWRLNKNVCCNQQRDDAEYDDLIPLLLHVLEYSFQLWS